MEVKHLIRDRKKGCPVGKNKCDDCNWYRALYRKRLDGSTVEEWDCQLNNLVTLMGETKDRTLGVQAAVETLTACVDDAAEFQPTLPDKREPRLING